MTIHIFWSMVACFFLVVSLFLLSRKMTFLPKTYRQNILELTVEFIEKQIISPAGLSGRWTVFILTIFLFILFNDWIGLFPGALPATSNINTTGSLAVMVFLISIGLRFKGKGFWGSLKSLIPEGVRGPLIIILFPIELISQLFKPFSLAIRLFANMSGGHLLMLTIIGFTTLFGNVLVSFFSVAGSVFVQLFEIFVGFIQAYVFSLLSAIFIGESLAEEN